MASNAKNFAARWGNAEPPPWIVEQRRREEGVAKVCRTLHTTKMMICDPLLTLGLGSPSIDPSLLEKWLVKHGKYSGADGENIRDAVEKHFGRDTADLIDSLF
jgi:hypothetical protein